MGVRVFVKSSFLRKRLNYEKMFTEYLLGRVFSQQEKIFMKH